MPMIDIYAAAGTFADIKKLAADAAALVKSVEQVPDIPMFRKNMAAFVHLAEKLLRGREMPTHTERTHQVRQIERILEISHADFTRAFESLLGRMPVEALSLKRVLPM